jgi:hypothetical protein
MKHTEEDIEKNAFALTRFDNRLEKAFLWRKQKVA